MKQLRAFCEAARHGSISRAAERIGASQPAVSMQVRALEDELGVSLFERRGARIEVRTGTGPERLEWLRRFELDAALGVVDLGQPGIEFHPFRTSTMVLATPPDHPLVARAHPVEPEALNRLNFIAPTPAQHARRLQDLLMQVHGVTARVMVEVDGWGAILNHVAAGAGVAFVPDVSVAASERVATVTVNVLPVHRVYGIAVRRERMMSLAARRFLEAAFAEPPGA